ncbi:OmpA family protein [Oligoflexus tunisiensis]|uniref:OmpA family protein n=1 Tax=Oligoflexus tunisiensis TaxID=708132 RepID=UPI000B195B2F|nr:OmpA family protein [Oligoflexus tunisiensis]
MRNTLRVGSLAVACLMAVEARANITGSDLQNFNASYTPADSVTVHGAKTMGSGRLSLGLFANNAVNTLPYFNEEGLPNIDQKKSFSNSVTGLELAVSYGITSFWDISLALPSFVAQTVEKDDQLHGYFARLGITELRIANKFQLLATDFLSLGLMATANHNRVQNNPYSGNMEWPSFALELLGTLDFGFLTWSTNVGYRWHHGEPTAELQEVLPVQRFGDQWVASTGVDVKLPATDLTVQAEVYGSYAKQDFSSFSPRNTSIMEGLVGLKYPLDDAWTLYGGYGSEMRHALSSADNRFYAGVRWTTDLTPAKPVEVAPAPAPVAPVVPVMGPGITERAPDAIVELDDIYFHFDSTAIRDPKGYEVMQRLKELLQSNRNIERVVIEGHACALGTDDYNFGLSDRRADTIERWLMRNYGIPPEKLLTVGWGEKRPKVSNAIESSRMLNRRATFKIYYEMPRIPAPRTPQTQQAH